MLCSWWDSNPQSVKIAFYRRLCLPFHHTSIEKCLGTPSSFSPAKFEAGRGVLLFARLGQAHHHCRAVALLVIYVQYSEPLNPCKEKNLRGSTFILRPPLSCRLLGNLFALLSSHACRSSLAPFQPSKSSKFHRCRIFLRLRFWRKLSRAHLDDECG